LLPLNNDKTAQDRQASKANDQRRQNFELFEDEKKQTITHFASGESKQTARRPRPKRGEGAILRHHDGEAFAKNDGELAPRAIVAEAKRQAKIICF